MNTTPTSTDPNDSLPDALVRFERDLRETSDPGALLERYQREYPELAETLGLLAEAAALLGAAPSRQTVHGRSAPDVHPPDRFGPYKVVRSIGRGGMGEVYEAVEEPLGRHVAIKTIRRQAVSRGLLTRFDRERRTLARLHHTNIVPIYATGSEGDLLYFAMPYLPGASLGQVIKTARSHERSGDGLASSSFEDLVHEAHSRSQSASDPPEPREPAASPEPTRDTTSSRVLTSRARQLSKAYIRTAVQVMATVAEGLHHAHEAGVIHRDLKPGNIIVQEDGHAWVLDFGLAAFRANPTDGPLAFAVPLPPSESDDALTVGPIGTPPYMAPEQHTDGKQADARSDVWSLGATLYELLTLQRAFPNGKTVRETDPTPPRRLTPALDRDLEAVVLKALHKDPAHRYPTAQALADDLNHWLRHEPVTARPARTLRRVMMWSRRNRGWAAAIVITTLAVVGAGAGGTEYYRMQAQARARRLKLLDIQRMEQSDHIQGWSQTIWNRIAGLTWTPEEKWAVQAPAVASLSGLDTKAEKRLPMYAQSLAFAPDGRLWMGHTGEGVKRWNPETDRLDSWPLEVSGPLAIRPDGMVWQLGPTYTEPDRPNRIPLDPRSNPRFPLQLLDVEHQKIARTLADPVEGGSRLLAWTLAPKGSHAAATVLDPQGKQHILVWDAGSGNLLHRIASRRSPESPALPGPGLSFSPDPAASLLASWDGTGRVDLWNVADGQAAASFTVRNPVHCVAFGPNHWLREAPRSAADRWMVAVGDSDGLVALWNPSAQGAWQFLRSPGLDVLSLQFSPDGTLLASAGRTRSSNLWDVATGRHLLMLDVPDYTTALAFSPDGKRLACSYYNPFEQTTAARPGTFILSVDPGRGIRHLHGLPGSVVKVVFSRDGKRVSGLSWDWWAGVWDRDTGRLIRLVAVPRGQFADSADLRFSPDARSLAVSAGNTATLWDLETGQSRKWVLPWALTEAIAFADAGRLMLMRTEVRDGSRPPDSEAPPVTYPRVCVLRNLLGRQPAEPVKSIVDLNSGIQLIKASPDATHFVVDGDGGVDQKSLKRSVRVYRADGTFVTELPTNIPPGKGSGGFTFDPTGRLLIHNPWPRPVLLEFPSGRFLGSTPIKLPIGVAQDAHLWIEKHPDDGRIQVCDRAGKLLIDRPSERPSAHGTAFSPDLDGRFIIWGNRLGTIFVEDLVEIQRRLSSVGLGW